mgnify:CR=1 FL=1
MSRTNRLMMNRLRDLREERNLTQEKVAKALGIGQAGYSKYECEKIDIPTDILLKLSDYYNTSIDYILCRTNNKNPYKKSEKYDKIMSRWLIYGKLSK